MTRNQYQILRQSVESEIADHDSGRTDSIALANSLMRLFLQAQSAEQVRNQVSKRELLTFRRNPDAIAPSWAYRKPGISSRLPTL